VKPTVLLLLALVVAPASGQAPPPPPVVPVAAIDAPASIPAGTKLLLQADGSTSKGRLYWSVVTPKGTPFQVYDSPGLLGSLLIVNDPRPGTLYKFALVATGDVPPFAFDWAEVQVQTTIPPPSPPTPGPTPTPTPTPVPTPPPVPAGYAGPLNAVLIYDLNDVADATAPVRISSIAADLAALGATWYPLDSRTPSAAPFVARMQQDNIAVPSVYVTDKAGKVRGKVVAPTSKDPILALVKSIRGTP
jgi:hypothetical protein